MASERGDAACSRVRGRTRAQRREARTVVVTRRGGGDAAGAECGGALRAGSARGPAPRAHAGAAPRELARHAAV